MRGMEGWAWDSVNYAMWRERCTMVVYLFLDSGAGNRGDGICFAYNRSQCNHNLIAEGVGVSTLYSDAKICKYTSQQPLPSTTCLDRDNIIASPVSGMVKAGCVFQSLGSVLALPVSVAMLLHFVAHLHYTGLAPSSIISIESAISYFHKINGCQDSAKNFIISKLLAGAQNLKTGSDIRLPIKLPILAQLISAYITLCVMLSTMVVLAFRAYLRVGDMVPRTSRVV